jgi:hypothetical protein
MKFSFSILLLLAMVQFTKAQDSWTVKLNNRVLLTTSKEDTLANTRRIKNFEWRKNSFLEISFKESEPDAWNRSFLFCDENDNQLLTKENTTNTKISVNTLRTLFAGKKKIVIYTIVAPKNPMIAMRTRRIHLCTLLLP